MTCKKKGAGQQRGQDRAYWGGRKAAANKRRSSSRLNVSVRKNRKRNEKKGKCSPRADVRALEASEGFQGYDLNDRKSGLFLRN